jgi:hypothetical protein
LRRVVAIFVVGFVAAGCGASTLSSHRSAPRGGVFSYDASAPLGYVTAAG